MVVERILACIGVISMGIFGSLLTFCPSRVVRWQAQWYKFLWEQVLRVGDQGIPPKQRAAILKGIETPEKCTFNIRAYRFLGIFILLAAIVGALVIALSFLAD